VCTRGSNRALLGGLSTSPLERTMHAVRLVVLTVLLLGLAVLMMRSVTRALRTGTVTLKGGATCRRSDTPLCFWTSMVVTVVAVGVFVAAWWYVMFLQQASR
jgi:hypothetical protein